MAELTVVMYHYVQDFERSRFPALKGMPIDDFRAQLNLLSTQFEMASLESMLAFLDGTYHPSRDLAALTFDDGLREHAEQVTPVLAERGLQGQFFVSTAPLTDRRVLPVHQVHLLMAELGENEFCRRVRERYESDKGEPLPAADEEFVRRTYRWDTQETANVKASLNFVLSQEVKESLIAQLFEEVFGEQAPWASHLYADWNQLREMQDAGMVIGGHSHQHQALSTLPNDVHAEDLAINKKVLKANLHTQDRWPFCIPYGKSAHYHPKTISELQSLGYCCAFSTERGVNMSPGDPWVIRRLDCKDIK